MIKREDVQAILDNAEFCSSEELAAEVIPLGKAVIMLLDQVEQLTQEIDEHRSMRDSLHSGIAKRRFERDRLAREVERLTQERDVWRTRACANNTNRPCPECRCSPGTGHKMSCGYTKRWGAVKLNVRMEAADAAREGSDG